MRCRALEQLHIKEIKGKEALIAIDKITDIQLRFRKMERK